jgi:hypothetical protein
MRLCGVGLADEPAASPTTQDHIMLLPLISPLEMEKMICMVCPGRRSL